MGKRLGRGFYWRGGIIWVRTDPIDHLPRSTGCRDPRAAELWRAERERVAVDPVYAASLTASLGVWVTNTMKRKREERSAGTVHMYGVKLGHFVRLWGADAALASISPELVDDYISARRAEGAASNTIARELTCLRQLLRLAKRGRAFRGDLAEVMPVAFSAEYEPVKRTLHPDHLPALWQALRTDEERAWVALALSTAADASDIERATKGDYDAVRSVFMLHGTKASTRAAEVPVLAHVRELFDFALARLPVSWPRASKGLGEACKRAGLPHLSPKDLRRTAASWLIASGAPQPLVSRFLRHRNDAMVRTVYGQLRPEELGKLLASSAETLHSNARPLGGMADAGDLKGDPAGSEGGGGVEVPGTYGPAHTSTGAPALAETLQAIGRVLPAVAAELVARRVHWVTVVPRKRKGARDAG